MSSMLIPSRHQHLKLLIAMGAAWSERSRLCVTAGAGHRQHHCLPVHMHLSSRPPSDLPIHDDDAFSTWQHIASGQILQQAAEIT